MDTYEYPYCCIGLIQGEVEGRKYIGTGCLIHRRIVLTCAHNIYDRSYKKEGTNLTFAPGADGKRGR